MHNLEKTSNCVYSLQYHLVATVKYRQKVFVEPTIIEAVKTIISNIAKDFDVTVVGIECGIDHIHLLFRSKPTLDVTKFINIVKGHSSRAIRKQFADFLADKLWGDNFWSPSYFLATTGNVTIDTLKEYVEKQRELQL